VNAAAGLFASPLAAIRSTLDPSVSGIGCAVRQFRGRSTVRGRSTHVEGESHLNGDAGSAALLVDAASTVTS
jgi:hypothetical protein